STLPPERDEAKLDALAWHILDKRPKTLLGLAIRVEPFAICVRASYTGSLELALDMLELTLTQSTPNTAVGPPRRVTARDVFANLFPVPLPFVGYSNSTVLNSAGRMISSTSQSSE